MKRLVIVPLVLVLAFGASVTNGCMIPGTELDLANVDPAQDHRKIAAYYSREAARLRQTAEELSARIAVYERLFGPSSDWVVGTRLLAQSYEEAAKARERKAREHLELVKARDPASLARTQHP